MLAELDKAANNSNGLMASAVLHGYEQKYPTNVLRVELERELDETLRKQVLLGFLLLFCFLVLASCIYGLNYEFLYFFRFSYRAIPAG